MKQSELVQKLWQMSETLKKIKVTSERKIFLKNELSKLENLFPVTIPISHKFLVNGVDIDKCKIMDSKKVYFYNL